MTLRCALTVGILWKEAMGQEFGNRGFPASCNVGCFGMVRDRKTGNC